MPALAATPSFVVLLLTAQLLHSAAATAGKRGPQAPEALSVTVVRSWAHLGKPFTQGLEFTADGRHLVESSGSFPPGTASFVRLVDLETGATAQKIHSGLSASGGRFVEGIVQLQPPHGHWFASTFQNQVVVEYDTSFNYVKTYHFPYTGWGLSRNANGTAFFATNGSEHVMTLQPQTFHLLDSKPAVCLGKHVAGLNELEMVDDFLGTGRPALLGNVYETRLVLALDPATMRCSHVFQLNGVGDIAVGEHFGFHVANGIAYNRHTGRFVVTGKNWGQMFEVSLASDPRGSKGQALSMLRKHLAPRSMWRQEALDEQKSKQHHLRV